MTFALWAGAGSALALAAFAGFRDWRRKRRSNLDAVGMIDWPGVQVFALIAAAILASLALRG